MRHVFKVKRRISVEHVGPGVAKSSKIVLCEVVDRLNVTTAANTAVLRNDGPSVLRNESPYKLCAVVLVVGYSSVEISDKSLNF